MENIIKKKPLIFFEKNIKYIFLVKPNIVLYNNKLTNEYLFYQLWTDNEIYDDLDKYDIDEYILTTGLNGELGFYHCKNTNGEYIKFNTKSIFGYNNIKYYDIGSIDEFLFNILNLSFVNAF